MSGGGQNRANAGKEFVPEFDGKTPMRDYERRVRVYEANTNTDPEYRAGKLIEKMKEQAWTATETLDIKSLRCEKGVEMLLDDLWQELEPLEF